MKNWKTIRSVFDTFFKYHPDNLYYRSVYLFWAYTSGRDYVAKEQFDILGDQWNVNPQYWSNKDEYFKIKKREDDWVAAHPLKK
jgi:hypothetical protein